MRRTRYPLALAILVASCGGNEYAPPPPPEVTVALPVQQEVTTYNEVTGRTVSIEAVEVRARVQGFLQSMHFTPGTEVKQGDPLFVIEPSLYQARVDQAAADLQSAQAQSQAADEQLAITRAIFERNAGSKTDLVQRTQARDQARAAVAQAKANLDAAKLDLSYTHIYAPNSGRIDRNYVDVGNLVGAGEATLLASIVRQDPIYAYFDVSERQVLVYRALRRRGETVAAEGERNKAYMALDTDDGFPWVGEVDYVSNRVNSSTGTMELRAIFPNPDRVIVPGLFVRVRLPFTRGRGLLVPDEAVSVDQGGRYVLVVDAQQVAQHRRVKIGALVDGMRVVQEGLTPEEWVVVNGLQRARPGSKVKPRQAPMTPTTAKPAETPG
ncbi:MAG: efflux RND transporter periplasmic adaptor subunit [Actinomycetota bacterium]|nr:efflux RND transporter periplasmic adaptor subunit [Actinomycetota bacterium]